MPRFSSLRSGLLLTLFLLVFGYGTFAFAQMDYAAMDAAKMGGMSGDPGAKDATGAQQGSIANVGSGIKRTTSSLGNVRALLYGDAVVVARINATKIDYESLAKFVDEFVDKAGGAVRSDDKYLVQLREYQKSSAKSSFKTLLSTVQNAFVQRCFAKNIDEAYFIEYKNENGDGCLVFAAPTDGLSKAEQKTALDAVHDLFTPITVFDRYGFIVAVLKHDAAESFDLEAIQDRYDAKMQMEKRGAAYGSYGASQGANNGVNGFGGSGMSGVGMTGTGMAGMGMMGMLGMGDSQNVAAQNPKYPNVLGLSPKLYAEYLQEVTEAAEKAQTTARRSTLPYVRRRFEKPASVEESVALFDALRQVDGAFVSCAFVDLSFFESVAEKKSTSGDDVAQPFSALGTDDSQKSTSSLEFASKMLKTKANWKSGVFALSLVGSPKLTGIAAYSDEETAKNDAQALQASLTLGKSFVQKKFDDFASEAGAKVDFTPLVDSMFTSLQPQIHGSKVAVLLDAAVLQEHSGLFLDLMGGVEKKSEIEQESEEIDWDLGGETKADESAVPTKVDSQASAEDDPFAEEPTTDAVQSSSNKDVDEDDPFGSDDEDPFAE